MKRGYGQGWSVVFSIISSERFLEGVSARKDAAWGGGLEARKVRFGVHHRCPLANYEFMAQLLDLALLARYSKILNEQSRRPFRPRHGYGCPTLGAGRLLWSPSPFWLSNNS